jgi:2-C-methyl-D-erythritol 4-phosphate cytidylyltransferase
MAKTVALIMAAGAGERFAGGGPKILHPLSGLPVLVRSTRLFARHRAVDAIIVVCAPGEETKIREVLDFHGVEKIARVVSGGATRQESARLGLEALDPECEIVLIHDAARPCLTAGLIDRVIEALKTSPAVVPVSPVVETLVRESGGSVDAILDRVHISGVQTPQGFHAPVVLRAHRSAKARGFVSSDDGSLVFALGEKVRTIEGERTNIKITFAEDAPIAEAILRAATSGGEEV